MLKCFGCKQSFINCLFCNSIWLRSASNTFNYSNIVNVICLREHQTKVDIFFCCCCNFEVYFAKNEWLLYNGWIINSLWIINKFPFCVFRFYIKALEWSEFAAVQYICVINLGKLVTNVPRWGWCWFVGLFRYIYVYVYIKHTYKRTKIFVHNIANEREISMVAVLECWECQWPMYNDKYPLNTQGFQPAATAINLGRELLR